MGESVDNVPDSTSSAGNTRGPPNITQSAPTIHLQPQLQQYNNENMADRGMEGSYAAANYHIRTPGEIAWDSPQINAAQLVQRASIQGYVAVARYSQHPSTYHSLPPPVPQQSTRILAQPVQVPRSGSEHDALYRGNSTRTSIPLLPAAQKRHAKSPRLLAQPARKLRRISSHDTSSKRRSTNVSIPTPPRAQGLHANDPQPARQPRRGSKPSSKASKAQFTPSLSALWTTHSTVPQPEPQRQDSPGKSQSSIVGG
jgi:hypothetical protein